MVARSINRVGKSPLDNINGGRMKHLLTIIFYGCKVHLPEQHPERFGCGNLGARAGKGGKGGREGGEAFADM